MAAVGVLMAMLVLVASVRGLSGPVTRFEGRRFVPYDERSPRSALSSELVDMLNAKKRTNMNWRGVPMLCDARGAPPLRRSAR